MQPDQSRNQKTRNVSIRGISKANLPGASTAAVAAVSDSSSNHNKRNNKTTNGTPSLERGDRVVPLRDDATTPSNNNNNRSSSTTTATTSKTDAAPAPVQLVKNYLNDKMLKDPLDEDKFCIEMIELDRISTDRLRYRLDPDHPNAYAEEIGFSQDQEFFKELCTKTGVDKRTVNWLRRKVGWNELTEMTGRLTDDSDDDILIGGAAGNGAGNGTNATAAGGDQSQRRRRKTRGSRRIYLNSKTKQPDTTDDAETGITALALAVTDLEQDFGAFKRPDRPQKPSSHKRKQHSVQRQRRQSLLQDLSRPKLTSRSRSRSPPRSPRPLPQSPKKRQKLTPASASALTGAASATNVSTTTSSSHTTKKTKTIKKRKAPPTTSIPAATNNDSTDTDVEYELIGSVSTNPEKKYVFDSSGLSPRLNINITKIVVGGKGFHERPYKSLPVVKPKKDNKKASHETLHKKKPRTPSKTPTIKRPRSLPSTPAPSLPLLPPSSLPPSRPGLAPPLPPPASPLIVPKTPILSASKKEPKTTTTKKKKKKTKKKKTSKGPRLLSSPLTSTPKIGIPRFLSAKAKKLGSPMTKKQSLPGGRIPLSLLEWRRRQQWTPSKDDTPSILHTDEDPDEGIIKVAANLEASGVETRLPSWLAINKYSEMTRQPPMSDPSRTCHEDSQYARWCSRLINCLNGSGRSWARHEFFYSDLDRPWYNFNEFFVDLAKVGVSPHAKLTRSEWSLVRQQIRKRPRRFSKRFIRKEMVRLNEYRKIVRRVQHTAFPLPANFGYAIPAPIAVGATVTAYNRKYRVLHRGTVLSYDVNRCMYLVQFERKELGFEFCYDFEVSSHGVPEFKHIAKETTLDGTVSGAFADLNNESGDMVYGTSYALTLNSWHQRHKGVSLQPVKTDEDDEEIDDFLQTPLEFKLDDETLVDKVAERECIIKLLDVIEKSMQRKSFLLDAVEEINRRHKQTKHTAQPSGESNMEEYSWLFANLQATEEVLEAAVAHLQVMYCSPLETSLTSRVIAEKEAAHDEVVRGIDMTSPHSLVGLGAAGPWASALTELSGLGHAVASSTNDGGSGGGADNDTDFKKPSGARRTYIESRLGRTAGLLMKIGEVARLTQPVVQSDHATPVAVESASKTWLDQVGLPKIEDGGSEMLSCALQSRSMAMKELQDALAGFTAEFTMLHSNTVETGEL